MRGQTDERRDRQVRGQTGVGTDRKPRVQTDKGQTDEYRQTDEGTDRLEDREVRGLRQARGQTCEGTDG